jgi:hypothetical protein
MKDQHTLIKGYRNLSQEEIDLMNEIKLKGQELGQLVSKLYSVAPRLTKDTEVDEYIYHSQHQEAERWVRLAKDHLQLGLMALTHAVAKPESF